MAAQALSEQDWRIRLHVYRHFVAHGRPPAYAEVARQLRITADEARHAYHRLHDGHALFLEPGTDAIRMAHPLSAVPTPYRVHAGDRPLYANCAWDTLGIPAMLHANARIEATFAQSGGTAHHAVEAGRLKADGGIVHIALPFRRWYDDPVRT